MKKVKIVRFIILIFIIIWMLIVFELSNQTGTESSGLSLKISSIFTSNEEIAKIIEPYIRKLAHLSEYAFRRSSVYFFIFNI